MSRILLSLLFSTCLSLGVASTASAQRAPDRLLVGYWHNWGYPNALPLTAIPDAYDVVDVAFAVPTTVHGATMQFTPEPSIYPTAQGFLDDVAALQAAGKKVLISIGGANHPVVVDSPADAQAFASSMLQIITAYGFDGLDVDLEGSSFSLQAGDVDLRNPTTPRVVHFLSGLGQLLAQLPQDFLLTAAPETAMVQGGMSAYAGVWGSYLPLLHAFRDRFDWVHVQHYNSGTMFGRDGQIYAPATVDFHVAMADALIGGFTTANGVPFAPLAPDQVAIGLPASTSAAGSGFTPAAAVHSALDRLMLGAPGGSYPLADPDGYPSLRGLMTWSVNWDVHAGLSFSTPHRAYLDQVFLQAGAPSVSAGSGGAVSLTLSAGRANAGRAYLLLASFSGSAPGTPLPGGPVLPLNFDALTYLSANPSAAAFQGFSGALDADGAAAAQLTVPPVPLLAGRTVSFAYALSPWDFASNSARVTLTP